ncbi:hypothetical protein EKO27_g7294 [Xylaria grammica]|uniref:SNF2 N-terminal domain-containing protein n=1 Tax=Xylaria grammica TaxID=363999 RepID=A0A439D0C0_9PEZI|nr:hypothetical protein EKO27_g7294 [Xylaria grammica]
MDVKIGSKRPCPSPVTLGGEAKIPRMLLYEETTEDSNLYDETLWPMDCDGGGDLVKDRSDSQQHDYSVLTESQANDTMSEASATSITELMEACSNYDTCFSVLPIRLDATLLISEVDDVKEKGKPQKRKQGATESTQDLIRIVLHGLRHTKEAIGNNLSEAGIFLQHPSAAEVMPEARQESMKDSAEAELTDDIRGGRLRRIFETAEADGGSVTIMNVAPSPRLRTPLMRHQVLALAMMQEKESGFVEEPMFPSLWRKECARNGNSAYYRHKITRSLESKPIPALGGILADDMGLGKTLSMLALICASLDFNSTTEGQNIGGESQGTLIVTPKSTISGWVTQAERQATIRAQWAANEGAGALFSRKWLRVVLDEGSSPHSQLFEPDFPIQDEHPRGVERLQELIRATCLRRMKDKVPFSNETKLPPRSERIHEVHLHQDDRNLYDTIKTVCAETAAGLAQRPGKSPLPKGKENNLMVLINSLRLICDHGEQLLPETVKSRIEGTPALSSDSGMERIRSGSYSTRDAQAYNYAAWGLEHQMSMEEGSQITDSHSNLGDGIDNSAYRPSAKVLATLSNLEQERKVA